MAGSRNCSETKISTLATKRRSNLSNLSRILKSQTSFYRSRRDYAKKTAARGGGGGLKMFFIKSLIGAGAVFLSIGLGVWGEPEESKKIFNKIKHAVTNIEHKAISVSELTTEWKEQLNKSTGFVKTQLESIPEEIKTYYDKSEKAVKDLFTGKQQ